MGVFSRKSVCFGDTINTVHFLAVVLGVPMLERCSLVNVLVLQKTGTPPWEWASGPSAGIQFWTGSVDGKSLASLSLACFNSQFLVFRSADHHVVTAILRADSL